MSQFVSAIDDAGFEREVLQSDVPVVLDFWAEWCPPCRALAPTFEELAKQYDGRVRFLKLNVDENQQVPQRFGIRASRRSSSSTAAARSSASSAPAPRARLSASWTSTSKSPPESRLRQINHRDTEARLGA